MDSLGGEDFWWLVEREVQCSIPVELRDFMILEGRVEAFAGATTDVERRRIIKRATDTLRNLWSTGVTTIGREEETLSSAPTDARWTLFGELAAEFARAGSPADSPAAPWYPMTFVPRGGQQVLPFPSQRIILEFDNRLALSAIVQSLRESWPEMRRRGWLQTTRPLDDTNIDLVRFVCLESPPGTTWVTRTEAWNSAHPERCFNDARHLQTAFRRAEEQLTGHRGGLAWFYDEDEMTANRMLFILERGVNDLYEHHSNEAIARHRRRIEQIQQAEEAEAN